MARFVPPRWRPKKTKHEIADHRRQDQFVVEEQNPGELWETSGKQKGSKKAMRHNHEKADQRGGGGKHQRKRGQLRNSTDSFGAALRDLEQKKQKTLKPLCGSEASW
jgi:hypothetical protein